MKLTTARTLLFAAPLALVLSVAAPPTGASPLKGSSPKGSGSNFLDQFAKPNNPTPGTDPFGFGPGNPNPAGTGPGDPNFDEVINHLGSPLPLSGVESIPPGGATAIDKAISAMDQATAPPVTDKFHDVPSFGGGSDAAGAIGLLLYDGDLGELLDLPDSRRNGSGAPNGNTPLNFNNHFVQSGQTLSEIAADYGLTVQELATANKITDINAPLYSGQSLTLPPNAKQPAAAGGKTEQSTATSTPQRSASTSATRPATPPTPVSVSITVTAGSDQAEGASVVVFDSRGIPVAQGKTTRKSGGRPKLEANLPPGTYRIVTGWTDRQGRTHSGTQTYTVTTGKNETDLGITTGGYANPARSGRPPR